MRMPPEPCPAPARWPTKAAPRFQAPSPAASCPVASQRVELGPAIVLRIAPVRPDPPLVFKPVQRRVKRPLANLQHVFRNLLNALRDTPAMHRPRASVCRISRSSVPCNRSVDGGISFPSTFDNRLTHTLVDCQGKEFWSRLRCGSADYGTRGHRPQPAPKKQNGQPEGQPFAYGARKLIPVVA